MEQDGNLGWNGFVLNIIQSNVSNDGVNESVLGEFVSTILEVLR